jgi:hypothetical protein
VSVVTLVEARDYLKLASNDDSLQPFIDRAEAAIGQRVGPLAPTAKTERVRGFTFTLRLSTSPIISLTTVSPIEGGSLNVSQLTALSGGRIVYAQGGYFGSRFYDVTVQAGRAALPEDLKLAVLEMVRHLYETQRGGAGRVRGGAQIVDDTPAPLPRRVAELIQPYVPVLGA